MLWMTSRSRSSLVSKVFAEHGVWWGATQVTDPAGYDWYENQVVKNLQKRIFGGLRVQDPIVPGVDPIDKFVEQLLPTIPENTRWSVKTGVELFNAFQPLNPYNIFITRPAKDVADSLCRKRAGTNWDEAFRIANWRFALMNTYQKQHGGVFVDTDKLITNDYEEIKHAVEYCELEFDPAAVERAIER